MWQPHCTIMTTHNKRSFSYILVVLMLRVFSTTNAWRYWINITNLFQMGHRLTVAKKKGGYCVLHPGGYFYCLVCIQFFFKLVGGGAPSGGIQWIKYWMFLWLTTQGLWSCWRWTTSNTCICKFEKTVSITKYLPTENKWEKRYDWWLFHNVHSYGRISGRSGMTGDVHNNMLSEKLKS